MNPAIAGLLRHAITVLAGAVFMNSNMSPDDLNSIGAAAVALIGVGWSLYEKRAEGFGLTRKRYEPGDEVREGGQTWVCKE